MNVLALPSSVVGFTASSLLIVIVVLAAYVVWTMGYPRPLWTHYTLDANRACARAVERLIKALATIKEAIHAEPQCTTILRINAAVGSQITTLSNLFDLCVSELSHAEMVDMCTIEILGLSKNVSPRVASLIQQWNRLGATDLYTSDLITSDGGLIGKRTACAIADLRLVTMHVIPSIQRVHIVHTKSMTNTEIINIHVASEFVNYKSRVKQAFNVGEDSKARDQAKLLTVAMNNIGKELMARKSA